MPGMASAVEGSEASLGRLTWQELVWGHREPGRGQVECGGGSRESWMTEQEVAQEACFLGDSLAVGSMGPRGGGGGDSQSPFLAPGSLE